MEPTIYKPSIYKGAGIYNTGADSGGFTPISGSVELFGKIYNTIKINGLEWICENIDYKWDGLLIGHNTTSPQACYPQDDESLWGWNGRKCGLLYNKNAKIQLNGILNDWRVGSLNDYDKLLLSCGSYFNANKNLTKSSDWSSLVGLDTIGFSELACGAYESLFYETNTAWYVHVNDINADMITCRPEENYRINYSQYTANWYLPIRLCRDA